MSYDPPTGIVLCGLAREHCQSVQSRGLEWYLRYAAIGRRDFEEQDVELAVRMSIVYLMCPSFPKTNGVPQFNPDQQ
jgi:hypothetical protein